MIPCIDDYFNMGIINHVINIKLMEIFQPQSFLKLSSSRIMLLSFTYKKEEEMGIEKARRVGHLGRLRFLRKPLSFPIYKYPLVQG